MFSFKQLSDRFNSFMDMYEFKSEPQQLYDPVRYILSIGGKRIRPLICLAGTNVFSEEVEEAMEAALCVEVFHNFSLVHDDLMDAADMRRGLPSVHKKYDDNTAILSGDVMLIFSYQLLEKYSLQGLNLMSLFSQTAVEVCEGQRYDMDFEREVQPSIESYIHMIELKTSVLIACALKMGALIGGASQEDAKHLYEFGRNLGIAFQIQDDLLDTFGEQEKVGKKIGGDIVQKKKTYLYLKSLEILSAEQSARLKALYTIQMEISESELISEVKSLFGICHVHVHAQELKMVYQQLAFSHLDAVTVDEDRKKVLREFAHDLLDRSY